MKHLMIWSAPSILTEKPLAGVSVSSSSWASNSDLTSHEPLKCSVPVVFDASNAHPVQRLAH